MDRSSLLLHPVRLRILQVLSAGPATTETVADRMSDVPRSSVYRHVKLLVDGGLLEQDDSVPTTDPRQKAYRVKDAYHLSAEDMAALTPEAHVRLFSIYAASLIGGFERYMMSVGFPDLARDMVGYTETYIYADDEEMVELASEINKAIISQASNGPQEGRRRRKFAFITHPEGE